MTAVATIGFSNDLNNGWVWLASALAVRIAPCTCEIAGVKVSYAGIASQAVPAASTTRIWITSAGVLGIGAAWPNESHVRLASVVTDASAITSIVDERAFLSAEGGTPLCFGATTVLTAAVPYFLWPGYSNVAVVNDVTRCVMVPRSGVLRNLGVRYQAADGDGDTITWTVYVNGGATAMTCTLATGAIGSASDLVNTVPVSRFDRVAIRGSNNADITSGTIKVVACVDLI